MQPSAISHRCELIKKGVSKLFSINGAQKLVSRPSIAINFLRAFLFDVKLRKQSISDRLKMYEASISALAELSIKQNPQTKLISTIEEAIGDVSEDSNCKDLAALLKNHGSDKSTVHNYHLVYAALLGQKRQAPLNIFEIGLGTNNIDTQSNMGANGRPGASLRAFRDWAPNANIFGADVDARILFSENRIRTFFVDQTKPETLRNVAKNFQPKSFDLVIDDGLHNSEANLNSLLFALELVRDDGAIVIEDVSKIDLPFWQTAFSVLGTEYTGKFIKTKYDYIVLIRKSLPN
ncbi:MAG: O-methyltransferase [Bacteriovoracaceae bacterium]|nr:O-methyltransferase [Bacteriovoracaceae bacterium]